MVTGNWFCDERIGHNFFGVQAGEINNRKSKKKKKRECIGCDQEFLDSCLIFPEHSRILTLPCNADGQ